MRPDLHLLGPWRKSQHSNPNGACVELAPAWITSSYSASGNCVQAVRSTGTGEPRLLIRDSKLGDASPILAFTPAEAAAFFAGVKDGEFDGLLT